MRVVPSSQKKSRKKTRRLFFSIICFFDAAYRDCDTERAEIRYLCYRRCNKATSPPLCATLSVAKCTKAPTKKRRKYRQMVFA